MAMCYHVRLYEAPLVAIIEQLTLSQKVSDIAKIVNYKSAEHSNFSSK